MKNNANSEKRNWLTLGMCAAVAVCLFGQLGAMGLTGPDEPRYVWIARAMAQTGDWVTPRLYGQPWFEKPILYYWAAAIGFRMHLSAEWASRLPSALGALATALAIAWLAKRFYGDGENWGQNPAVVAPLVFATSIAGIGFSRAATPDMLFSTFIVLAMACAAKLVSGQRVIRSAAAHTHGIAARETPALALFGAFLGMATLAKGPAAVILAGGAMLIWAVVTRRWREALRLAHPIAIAAWALAALPWYVICALRNPDFLRVFILQHNFERYLTPVFEHKQPFWFFGPIFLAALLPWTIFLLPATREGLRLWKEKSWRDSPGFFFACWTVFPILFFSASQSKLPSYILPAIAPAAILCAVAAVRAFEDGRSAELAAGLAATWITATIAGLIFVRKINWAAGDPLAPSTAPPHTVYAALILLGVAALAMGLAALRGNARWAVGLCVLCAAASVETANVELLPRVEGRYSARPYAEFLRNDIHPDRIFTYELPRAMNYGLAFYFQRELPEWSPSDPDPAFVLSTKHGLADIQKLGRTSGALDLDQGGQNAVIYVPVNIAPRPQK